METQIIAFCSHNKNKYNNTFLGGDEAIFSNWYPSTFTFSKEDFIKYLGVDSEKKTFVSVEQGLMFGKAILFEDTDLSMKIMKTDDPKIIKDFGRKVKGYDQDIWASHRYYYATGLILEKFKQNDDLLQILKKTGSATLVEGAWYDDVWGVGLKDTDPLIHDQKNWKGQNLLGKCLMKARDLL